MRPPTWALNEVDPVGLHRQLGYTCAGNLGIVKILRYLRSDKCTASATNSELIYITRASKRNFARLNKNALGPP